MDNSQNFISISYSNIGFLIQKDVVLTAFSCTEKSVPQQTKIIDLDQYAINLNQKIDEANTKKCIILNPDGTLKEENQIALKTSADCRVKLIKYKDFSLFSDFYNDSLKEKGILACSFQEDNFISYLLDIGVFLHNLEKNK